MNTFSLFGSGLTSWIAALAVMAGTGSGWCQQTLRTGPLDVTLTGKALNTSTGSEDVMYIRLTSSDGNNYRVQGSITHERRSSRIDAVGVLRSKNTDSFGIQLYGVAELVGNDARLPNGTRTGFTLSLLINQRREARGVYQIDRLLPVLDWEQFGTVLLAPVPTAGKP